MHWEKGYADVTKMGENFAVYLGTADGKQRLSNGLSGDTGHEESGKPAFIRDECLHEAGMRAYAKSFEMHLRHRSSAMEQIIGQMSSVCHDTDGQMKMR